MTSYTDTDDSVGLLDIHLSYKEEEKQLEGLAPLLNAADSQVDVSNNWGNDACSHYSSHSRVHMTEIHHISTKKTKNVMVLAIPRTSRLPKANTNLRLSRSFGAS